MADKDFADHNAPPPILPMIPTTISSFQPITPITPNALTPPQYTIWQRYAASEFFLEVLYVLVLIIFAMGMRTWGAWQNRRIAREWVEKNKDVLEREFAMIGFDEWGRANTLTEVRGDGLLAEEGFEKNDIPVELILRENSPTQFEVFATGRNNVAFVHISIELMRRNNPVALIGQFLVGSIFKGIPLPRDNVTIIVAPLDIGEQVLFRQVAGGGQGGGGVKFDNFVWAVVNKMTMNKWREERYDLSLTMTSDCEGLPRWCSVMTEAKEIGDLVLTSEVREAVEQMGEGGGLEYLIVSDQWLEYSERFMPSLMQLRVYQDEFSSIFGIKNTTLHKRLTLHLTLPTSNFLTSLIPFLPLPPSNPATPALLSAFIRLTDHLVSMGHFPPNVQKILKATRDKQMKALQKLKEAVEKAVRDRIEAVEKAERDRKMAEENMRRWERLSGKQRKKEMRRRAKKGRGIRM